MSNEKRSFPDWRETLRRQGFVHPDECYREFRLVERPRLSGRTAFVTGAGVGVGKGIAWALAAEGAKVLAHYVNEDESAAALEKTVKAGGGELSLLKADFSILQNVEKAAAEALSRLGRIDVLVNNAGITANMPLAEVRHEFFETLYRVNVGAVLFLTQAVAADMISRGIPGRIINFGSPQAERGAAEHAIYAATKGAVQSMTRALALELIGHGIIVQSIIPGWALSENHFTAFPAGTDFGFSGKNQPTEYAAAPLQIGEVLVDLLGMSNPELMLGQDIHLTGGQDIAIAWDAHKPCVYKAGRTYLPGLAGK